MGPIINVIKPIPLPFSLHPQHQELHRRIEACRYSHRQGGFMKWFYDLRISKKLLISFILVLALTTTLGIFSIVQLGKVHQASTGIGTKWVPSFNSSLEFKVVLGPIRTGQLQHVLVNKEEG